MCACVSARAASLPCPGGDNNDGAAVSRGDSDRVVGCATRTEYRTLNLNDIVTCAVVMGFLKRFCYCCNVRSGSIFSGFYSTVSDC